LEPSAKAEFGDSRGLAVRRARMAHARQRSAGIGVIGAASLLD